MASVRAQNTDIAVIPGGLTSLVQPLDVSINKPFKDMMRKEWNEWMIGGEKTYTKGGSMRSPTMPEVCQWVINSWNKLKVETIVKALKKCGISNALDGTEDEELWNDTDEEAADDVQPQPMESDDEVHEFDDIQLDE